MNNLRKPFEMLLFISSFSTLAFALLLSAKRVEAPRLSLHQPAQHSTKPGESGAAKISFVSGNSGEIKTEDGVRLGFTNYKASDGVNLRVLYWDFGNAQKTTEFFN